MTPKRRGKRSKRRRKSSKVLLRLLVQVRKRQGRRRIMISYLRRDSIALSPVMCRELWRKHKPRA